MEPSDEATTAQTRENVNECEQYPDGDDEATDELFPRHWVLARLDQCLHSDKTGGVLLVGGVASGKTCVCRLLSLPSDCSSLGAGRCDKRLQRVRARLLGVYECRSHVPRSLAPHVFVSWLTRRLGEPVRTRHEHSDDEQQDAPASSHELLASVLQRASPPRPGRMAVVVDGVDVDRHGRVARLLATVHALLPAWLLLVVTARTTSRSTAQLFSNFHKIVLDDVRCSHVVRDQQRYILWRLQRQPRLRRQLSADTAPLFNQLYIKSNGCLLYVRRVLDDVCAGDASVRDVAAMPATLAGLYLWLCQRVFTRRRWHKARPVLDVLLAADRPLTHDHLLHCVRLKNVAVTRCDFQRRVAVLSRLLVRRPLLSSSTLSSRCSSALSTAGEEGCHGDQHERQQAGWSLFHGSLAEWLSDVKYCTQHFLCDPAAGHGMLAACALRRADQLTSLQVRQLASDVCGMTQPEGSVTCERLALLMLWAGVSAAVASEAVGSEDEAGMLEAPVRQLLLLVSSGACDSQLARDCDSAAITTDACGGDVDAAVFLTSVDIGQEPRRPAGSQDAAVVCGGSSPELEVDGVLEVAGGGSWSDCHSSALSHLVTGSTGSSDSSQGDTSAVLEAARCGDVQRLRRLLSSVSCTDERRFLLENSDQSHDCTPLAAASWAGHCDCVDLLLHAGACVDAHDRHARTPLMAAAYMGHVDVVARLLSAGADVSRVDETGRTAVAVAVSCACRGEAGGSDVLRLLLQAGADVNQPDCDGVTPLLVAAFEGNSGVCQLLAEHGADLDAADRGGRCALLAAASLGHERVVRVLLRRGCYIDALDRHGRSVLSVAAASSGPPHALHHLLSLRRLDETHRDNGGWTPLHYAAYEGRAAAVHALLAAGAPPDLPDNDGRPPLVLAAQQGHAAAVHALLDAGADAAACGHDGKSALRMAALGAHGDCVQLLVAPPGDRVMNQPDMDGRTALYLVALDGRQPSMASLLVSLGADTERADTHGRTPLHVACWQGHRRLAATLLLRCGASVHAEDADRRTPLISAAWQGHAAVVRLLVRCGAVVDHECNQGATALCIAAQEGHAACVRALLAAGADPRHTDCHGRSAVRVAHKAARGDIVRLLVQCGASPPPPSLACDGRGDSSASMNSCSASTTETKPSSAVLGSPRRSSVSLSDGCGGSGGDTPCSSGSAAAHRPLTFTERLQLYGDECELPAARINMVASRRFSFDQDHHMRVILGRSAVSETWDGRDESPHSGESRSSWWRKTALHSMDDTTDKCWMQHGAVLQMNSVSQETSL